MAGGKPGSDVHRQREVFCPAGSMTRGSPLQHHRAGCPKALGDGASASCEGRPAGVATSLRSCSDPTFSLPPTRCWSQSCLFTHRLRGRRWGREHLGSEEAPSVCPCLQRSRHRDILCEQTPPLSGEALPTLGSGRPLQERSEEMAS